MDPMSRWEEHTEMGGLAGGHVLRQYTRCSVLDKVFDE